MTDTKATSNDNNQDMVKDTNAANEFMDRWQVSIGVMVALLIIQYLIPSSNWVLNQNNADQLTANYLLAFLTHSNTSDILVSLTGYLLVCAAFRHALSRVYEVYAIGSLILLYAIVAAFMNISFIHPDSNYASFSPIVYGLFAFGAWFNFNKTPALSFFALTFLAYQMINTFIVNPISTDIITPATEHAAVNKRLTSIGFLLGTVSAAGMFAFEQFKANKKP